MKLYLALFLALLVGPAFAQDQPADSTAAPQAADPLPAAIARWEPAIAKIEQRQQEEQVSDDQIVYYGSSSIRLWRSIAEDMAPWPAVQRGYGGAKLPDILHYAPRVIGPHLGSSNPIRCRALVLFVANDITGGKSDGTPQQVANRFAKLLSWIRDQDATVPVFWIEVTPTNSRWKVWPQIDDATQRIRHIINRDGNAHFISTAGAYLGVDGKPRAELFVRDQLHMNADGYKQWAILIKSRLHQILGATSPQPIQENELQDKDQE